MKALHQLFSSTKSKSNWLIYLALLIGFLILLVSVQLFINVNQFMKGSQQANDGFEYLVVNKKITNAMMGNNENSFFSEEEIQTASAQKAVKEIAFITSNNYEIEANTLGQLAFSTQLFFESIPNDYLDIKPENWHWKEGDQILPIILSADYLNLYNFGFALSQGLPQMSEETIQAIPFNITIFDKKHEANYVARIVGFTQRYSSILVPSEFMTHCNREFGAHQPKSVSRIILKTKEADHPDLVKFLSDHQYATQNEKLKSSKLKSIVNIVFTISSCIGLFVLVLSVFLLIFYIKLLIIESTQNLQRAYLMGYKPSLLQNIFLNKVIKPNMLLALFSVIVIAIGQYFIASYLKKFSILISPYIAWQTIFIAVLLLCLIYFLFKRRLHTIILSVIK